MGPQDEPDVCAPPDGSSPRSMPSPSPWRQVWGLVSAHNPFYLLSTAFLLHGSARWMQSAGGYDPFPLIGLVGGYVLMMAITAIVIVRTGGVWGDARSILLLVPILFVELALALDSPLVTNGVTGTFLTWGGFLFATCVTEGLLRGLPIRLSAFFRLPLLALLAILFLYPLLIVPAIKSGQIPAVSWRILLFSPLAAFVLLTLFPAVRQGPEAVSDNGTPWRWPWFPWTLFGVLVAGVCLRGYALSLSFDPMLSLKFDDAMQLSSAWGPYFLVPILLAVAVLLLEAGLLARNRLVQATALILPAACMFLALPWGPTSGPHREFLEELTRRAGSPLWLTLAGSTVFYAVAWWRHVRWAEPAFVTALILLTMVNLRSFEPILLSESRPLGLVAAGCVLLASGLWRRDSRRTLIAAVLGIAAVAFGPFSAGPNWVQVFVPFQLLVLSIFIVGRVFTDAFARLLRPFGAVSLFLGVVTSLLTLLDPRPLVPSWAVQTYLILLITLAFAAAYPLRSRLYFWTGVAGLALSMTEFFRRAFLDWRDTLRGEGFGSFLIAFALFLVAAGISAMKAGLGPRLAVLLPAERDKDSDA